MLERTHALGAHGPPKGSPLGVLKPPLGHKIHIFGDRQLKFGMQALEWLKSHMLGGPHAIGAQGAPGAASGGANTTPRPHKLHFWR